MSFYERIMGTTKNFWNERIWSLLPACLYWNGFPIQWSLDDLVNPDKHPSLSAKEEKKILARVNRVIKMNFEIIEKILKRSMHGYCYEKSYEVTPHEFIRYAMSNDYPPYNVEILLEELQQSARSDKISLLEAFQKRTTPRLATEMFDPLFRKIRIPKCNCFKNGKHSDCCIHKLAKLKGQHLHREQVKKCALKINQDCLISRGRKATPKEIYGSPAFQSCLKRLRSPLDADIVVSYPRSIIVKNWIPQAIGKRSKGRPRIQKRNQSKKPS